MPGRAATGAGKAPRVLIVGAGPTGLTAALELARRGIVAEVIDRRTAVSGDSRAVGLLPSSMELLRASGVERAILDEAVVLQGVVFHDGPRPIARMRMDLLRDPRRRIFTLPQDRTEALIARGFEALGGRVCLGTTLEGFAQDEGGVTARIAGAEARFDLLIGADGVRSTVRHGAAIPFEGFDLPGDWSIADVDAADWQEAGNFSAFLLPGGDVAIVVPMAGGRYRVISSRPDALAALPVPMRVSRVRRTGRFAIAIRQVPRYAEGRVFLAGDAAHCHSPVGGRGMNLGIADAADLARRIAEGGLDGYHAARHAEGRRTIALSEQGRRVVMSGGPLRRRLLFNFIRLAASVPPLNRAIARVATS